MHGRPARLPAHGARGTLERADQFLGDPATVETAWLRAHDSAGPLTPAAPDVGAQTLRLAGACLSLAPRQARPGERRGQTDAAQSVNASSSRQ